MSDYTKQPDPRIYPKQPDPRVVVDLNQRPVPDAQPTPQPSPKKSPPSD